jgi:hypothetical protein
MSTASTAAVEVLLGLPPLHMKTEAESRAGICRPEQWKPRSVKYGHAKEPILQMGTDKIIPSYVFRKTLIVKTVLFNLFFTQRCFTIL